MDIATLVGIAFAFIMIISGNILEGGSPMALLLIPPMMIVFGGTFGAAIAGGTLADALAVPGTLQKGLLGKAPKADAAVGTLVSLAEKARREGLLALEDAVKGVDDEFLKEGLQLAIDGTDPDELQEVLYAKVDAKKADDKQRAKIFEDMGGYAPTIGIIGTVMGLVHVLENLDKPEQLGHLIAGAFVATLWGVTSANVMFLPLAARLKRLSALEVAAMELVIEGILAIQAGSNPRIVARKLEAFLPPGTKKPEKAAA